MNYCINSFIVYGIDGTRRGYPFYREPENKIKRDKFEKNGRAIVELLNSIDFETFYKVLPMKEYCTMISWRQNISKKSLSQTLWFKKQLSLIIGSFDEYSTHRQRNRRK
ncbi:MAG: hypothetical protein HY738_15815 [Bacteroidia bacterium]|nr:hypothetical protein [Bacteroidia bacterium]